MADVLKPEVEQLREEYVLVQAWKKTASFIRYHNWYSDTLELDRTTVNLPSFLDELSRQLKNPTEWNADPIRIVPAPKKQQWHVTAAKQWEPLDSSRVVKQLRPLAHVSLRDQVVATALMLCIANRVETIQGDPRLPNTDFGNRAQVVSYGNRLFCDYVDGELHHRWGSATLYRAYYQDYRSFLERPELAAEAITTTDRDRVVIVHSDLSHFYDRVLPGLMSQKLRALALENDDPTFYLLADRVLNWQWDEKDSSIVENYAQNAELSDYTRVALPQGLVASGFFANIALLDFDDVMRESLTREIRPGLRLEDFSRYVDDLRFVLSVDRDISLGSVEELTTEWVSEILGVHAGGLLPSPEKTVAASFREDQRPLVRQSRKMARVQGAMSGGFDAIAGEEILDAVQGLIRSQEQFAPKRPEDDGWSFAPVADVRDATVKRFASARFRSTYRSLRPLLPDPRMDLNEEHILRGENSSRRSSLARTQADLDDEARAFSLGLIQEWAEDPSNVRLLRIALDIWPAADTLQNVLELIRPFTDKGGPEAPRRVALYCLAEVFRAGATETGFVDDEDSLPAGIDISRYRSVLRDEALRLTSLSTSNLPWYVKQQVLLFVAACDTSQTLAIKFDTVPETKHYRHLLRFLRGESSPASSAEFATLAVLSRRSFGGDAAAQSRIRKSVNSARLNEIARRDPSFAIEIVGKRPDLTKTLQARVTNDLALNRSERKDGWVSLATIVLDGGPVGPLRNDIALLSFASKFLLESLKTSAVEAITPTDVLLKLRSGRAGFSEVTSVRILPSRLVPVHSLYRIPAWCQSSERWRLQLGYLLRFILAGQQDFTRTVRRRLPKKDDLGYKASESNWHLRLYGLFNGHSAFGDDWLPISVWTENLLFALLRWPGCRESELEEVNGGIEATLSLIEARLKELTQMQGRSSNVLMLPMVARQCIVPPVRRPLRACIMQTAIPAPSDFTLGDIGLSNAKIRRKHRKHLSAALEAIKRMLALRDTHESREGRLDWLVLPELSVHPDDVQTHLVPFVRAYRTIVLAGLTYEALIAGEPLVNSALWIIPVLSPTQGLQVLIRRQGKQHLASLEQDFNKTGTFIQGFRPCQWLVGYDWSDCDGDKPLWLTASICYDATDLGLVSDLRGRSDVFAIPALNQDVNTFDQMALALHYHMFQMVIVANSGLFGGSNAYCPYTQSYHRQIFHLHGQPQASMAFLEIDDIEKFRRRQMDAINAVPYAAEMKWKFPPAGF
jgi:hypothetical protein